jgi:hypothetical protein
MTLPIVATELKAQSLSSGAAVPAQPLNPEFPTQPPALVREMVMVSHFDLKRVKELVGTHPSLAKAAWDWGFGDWETALGAASHMGNRAIAAYLLANGAHPSIFSAAMLGDLPVVKAFVVASPGIQRTLGPHSISLLAHAKAGGDRARGVFDYLQTLGDADAQPETPLSESDRAALLGTYAFGDGTNDEVTVAMQGGKLTWTRKGTMGRWIYHLGDKVFYPGGAPAVRIRFNQQDSGVVMTVSDPEVVLVARRKGVSSS